MVDPEREPRDKDNHGGRHVDCQDEEGQLPLWGNIEKYPWWRLQRQNTWQR